MLSLRTKDGLNLRTLKSEHRKAVIDALLPYSYRQHNDGDSTRCNELVQFSCTTEGAEQEEEDIERRRRKLQDTASRVRLTDPDGFLLSNDIISSVFAAIIS